jgi:secreted PhoX family phosphatase
VTPWGTWLSCEETVLDLSVRGGRRHGYVFEVRRDPKQTTGRPIVAMGRMKHEAVAIDPDTRTAFLTEDDDKNRSSGFYRFLPSDRSGRPGSYEAGGRLQAARVAGVANADLRQPSVGDLHRIEWVDVPDPDADPGPSPEGLSASPAPQSGPFLQGWARGALRMARGEGIWRHDGRYYVVDTSAGVDAAGARGRGEGALWEYDPRAETLRAIFVSLDQQVGDNIDNITVSPRGGIFLCEDGDGVVDAYGKGTRLLGLTPEGDSYAFAKNHVNLSIEQVFGAGKRIVPSDYRGEEWAGACFDPAGEVLFANIQRPGITLAIWGPWR